MNRPGKAAVPAPAKLTETLTITLTLGGQDLERLNQYREAMHALRLQGWPDDAKWSSRPQQHLDQYEKQKEDAEHALAKILSDQVDVQLSDLSSQKGGIIKKNYKIKIINSAPINIKFMIFQQPSFFSGDHLTYSNSLAAANVVSGGASIFEMDSQIMACAQLREHIPYVGDQSGYRTGVMDIKLAGPRGSQNACATYLDYRTLFLSPPSTDESVGLGAFMIVTGVASLREASSVYIGSAVKVIGQGVVMSSFIEAPTSARSECSPRPIFFVQAGNFAPGMVINFTALSRYSARCDASDGCTNFVVTYNSDETWSVEATA